MQEMALIAENKMLEPLRYKLNKTEKAIAKLIHKNDLPSSKAIEKLGKHFGENKDEYMSREEYNLHIASIKDKAVNAGVRWSRKRVIENREFVINTNTSQYQMPSPFYPKELKAWLKSFYKQKKNR